MRRESLLLKMATLTSAQVVVKIVNFFISIALVRYLGVQGSGQYAYIMAFVYPFGALADFGLATYTIREISKDRTRTSELMAIFRQATIMLAGTVAIAMFGIAILAKHDVVTTAGIIIVGLSNLIVAAISPYVVALTAREDFHVLSLYRVIGSVIGAAATVLILFWHGGLLLLLASGIVVNGAMLIIARTMAGETGPLPSFSLSAVQSMLRRSVPFAVLLLGFALYYRVDIVMLRWLQDENEVGLYAAAYRFLDVVILLAGGIGAALYPRFSNLAARDPRGVREIIEGTWRPMLLLGLPFVVGIHFVADPLVVAIFGHDFAGSGHVLQILIWGSLPLFWIHIPNFALNAMDRIWQLVGVYALSAAVNITANALLIPKWGAEGAGIATVACEWLNLALVVRLVRRELHIAFSYEGLWRYALAVVAMTIVLVVAPSSNLVAGIIISVLSYFAVLLLLGYLRTSEVLALKRLLVQ